MLVLFTWTEQGFNATEFLRPGAVPTEEDVLGTVAEPSHSQCCAAVSAASG